MKKKKSMPYYGRILKAASGLCLLGIALSFLATFSGLALLSLSGWFITSTGLAAIAGLASTFNYLLPGAFIRLFSYTRILARYGERYINHDIIFRVMADLRVTLFTALATLSFIDRQKLERPVLVNRFMTDLSYLEEGFLRAFLPYVTAAIVWLLIYFTVSCYLPWIQLYWLTLGIALSASFFPAYKILSRLSCHFRIEALAFRTQLFNTARGLITFAVYGLAGQQQAVFSAYSERIYQASYRLGFWQQNVGILTLGITSILLWLILNQGLTLLYASPEYGGPVLVLVFLGWLILEELFYSLSQGAMVALIQASQAGKALDQWIEKTHNLSRTAIVEDITTAPDCLSWEQLSYHYPDNSKPVLMDLSGQLTQGIPLLIQGESGRGKSTLLHLLAGELSPSAGKIFVDNQPLEGYSDSERACLIGLGWQQPYLFDMTIKENLILADAFATEDACWQALEAVDLADFVRQLASGLNTNLGAGGLRFSTGQAKRLDLARLLLKDAAILLLDEPTEGLDFRTETKVMEMLMEKSRNKMLLVVSHRPVLREYFSRHIIL